MDTRAKIALALVAAAPLVCSGLALNGGRPVATHSVAQADTPKAPAYRDVLDVPSYKSPLAAKTLVNGTARAGNRVFCAGERGHILYSDDQGKKWTQASVPVSSVLTGIHFPTPQQGWAVGHEGVVLHTSDGGATWTKQLDGRAAADLMMSFYTQNKVLGDAEMQTIERFVKEGPDKPFLDVYFEDDKTGFVVGAFNTIFQTTDGGKSWVPWFHRTQNPKHLHFFIIRKIGDDIFMSGEQGMVLRLDRKSGKFVAANTSYTGTLFGVTGKAGTLVAFGLRGNIFVSHDAGSHWTKVESGVESGIMAGSVTEDGRILLASAMGKVLASSDNGASFQVVQQDSPWPASTILAIGNDKLAVGGVLGIKVVAVK